MKRPIISQSLMKSYVDYLNEKECGVLFKAKYIDKDPEAEREPTDSMKVGIYFEYLCTGALPKNKIVPEAEKVYKGKPNEKLSAPYERATESAEVFKHIFETYGIKIKEVGLYLHDKDLNINGVIDIYAEWDGKPCFIDLKYSGLIDDRWNEMGWDLESLPMKDSLMIQGVHYKLLADRCLKIDDIDFYYFVFSSSEPNNVKIIRQNVDDSKKQSHRVAIANVSVKLENDSFTAHPTMLRCHTCPIAHKCQYKLDVPLINEIYY